MSTVTPPPPPSPEERRRPFQFSMATLMGTVTLIAVALALILSLPAWVGAIVIQLMQVGVVAFLLAGAIFAGGNSKTFCIGAIATQFLTQGLGGRHLLQTTAAAYPWNSYFWLSAANIAVNVGLVLLGGWFCVLARRFWESRTP